MFLGHLLNGRKFPRKTPKDPPSHKGQTISRNYATSKKKSK